MFFTIALIIAFVACTVFFGFQLKNQIRDTFFSESKTGTSAVPDGGIFPENAGTEAGSETEAKVSGISRWLTTTDHKDIGIMYIIYGTIAALWGGTDAMMIRTELLTPQADVWTAATYNALFTTHGLTMLILFVTPVFFGIANYFLPLLIGADDLAFPRINLLAFWMLLPAPIQYHSRLQHHFGGAHQLSARHVDET